jgi:hypothetical protein
LSVHFNVTSQSIDRGRQKKQDRKDITDKKKGRKNSSRAVAINPHNSISPVTKVAKGEKAKCRCSRKKSNPL